MKKQELEKFRKLLQEKRTDVIGKINQTVPDDMTLDPNDRADEMDQAQSGELQNAQLRFRDRQRFFLQKIDKALRKIDDGEFGICASCEEPINIKRLEARPETDLCAVCKEDQERMERDYV